MNSHYQGYYGDHKPYIFYSTKSSSSSTERVIESLEMLDHFQTVVLSKEWSYADKIPKNIQNSISESKLRLIDFIHKIYNKILETDKPLEEIDYRIVNRFVYTLWDLNYICYEWHTTVDYTEYGGQRLKSIVRGVESIEIFKKNSKLFSDLLKIYEREFDKILTKFIII